MSKTDALLLSTMPSLQLQMANSEETELLSSPTASRQSLTAIINNGLRYISNGHQATVIKIVKG